MQYKIFEFIQHAKADFDKKGRCAHLVAVHHEVVRGDERFEDHYPAVAGGALQQRVCQVGDADVQLIGAVNQVWGGGGTKQRTHGVNAALHVHTHSAFTTSDNLQVEF